MSGLRMCNLRKDSDKVFQEAGVGAEWLEDTSSECLELLS